MHHIPYVSILVCLMMTVEVVHAAAPSGGNPTVMTYNRDVMALEQGWKSTRQASYFSKALALFQATKSTIPEMDVDFHTSQLDLASGMLLKSRDGSEFGSDAGAVRCCQAEIIAQLADVDVRQLKKLAAWPELRARYARLLMLQRATWISLRDPTFDGKLIELDSTIHLQPDPVVQERLLRNQRIALQRDVKRFLEETGPAIDRFMIAAFSIEPGDFRMLNELLAMGLYTPTDRAKLVARVAGNIPELPDIVKIQLP